MAEPVEPLTPELEEIPDKLYFRIGEVARLTGVKQYVLRFWEGEFPGLGPKKSGAGHRLYRRKDVEAVLEIKRLLYDKRFTIEGARKALEGKPKAASSSKPARRGGKAGRDAAEAGGAAAAARGRDAGARGQEQADLFAHSPAGVDLGPIKRELRAILDLLG